MAVTDRGEQMGQKQRLGSSWCVWPRVTCEPVRVSFVTALYQDPRVLAASPVHLLSTVCAPGGAFSPSGSAFSL